MHAHARSMQPDGTSAKRALRVVGLVVPHCRLWPSSRGVGLEAWCRSPESGSGKVSVHAPVGRCLYIPPKTRRQPYTVISPAESKVFAANFSRVYSVHPQRP